ncbi:tRNA pseudouridine synthase D [subsurface metagenome]
MERSNNNTHIFQNKNERELEKGVGIEIYSTSGFSGISAIYKKRYKDFIVKEITRTGQILEISGHDTTISFSEDSKDKYTTFTLVKINKDTFGAIRMISRALKIHPNLIEVAGLKDKRSISVQKASIKGNHIEKLKKLKLKDIFVRCIMPTKKSVKLGSNRGNHFIITLRNIEKEVNEEKRIKALFDELHTRGFPNYYGLQRFGTFRPNSHIIGRFILEDEFVLATYSTELPQSQLVREKLKKTGDLEKAYNLFPESLNYERAMIKYLLDNPRDYEGAINHLPNYLIKLLISSFQSYLFNKMLSLRHKNGISLYKPIKGDVFSILDDDNGNITKIKYTYGGLYDKFLREANDLNRARIVIPLIGYNTKLDDFPLMKSLLLEILDKEQISAEIFNNELLYTYEFKGSFRPIIVKPLGLKILEYTEDDIFQNKNKLKIEFSLQKGSYATLLLREIIK